MELKDNTN